MLKLLLTYCAQLDKLEVLKRQLKKKETTSIHKIAEAVGKISINLYTEESDEDSDLVKDIMQYIRQRLLALAVSRDMVLVVGKAVEFSEERAGAYETRYRADIRTSGVWAGLTEASYIAANIIRVRCHIYTLVNGKYKRVITIGDSDDPMSNRHLLHTGNHYQVLTQAVDDGSAVNNQHIIPIAPDGDCLYESILVLNREPLRGKGIVQMLRGMVADGLSTQEVVAAILGIVWQGDHGGLGPNMARLVRSLKAQAKSAELDIVPKGLRLVGEWNDYLDHFRTHFRLTQVLSTKEAKGSYLLTNVGNAEDWLSAFSSRISKLERISSSNWKWLKRRTTANFTRNHRFTHLGVMWASIQTVKHGTIEFIAAAANYYWSEVETERPWIYHGTNLKKGSVRSQKLARPRSKNIVYGALDMHSECFCFFYLSQWLARHMDDTIQSVTIRFFLEKPMCDRCQVVCDLFLLGWSKSSVTIKFEDDTLNQA